MSNNIKGITVTIERDKGQPVKFALSETAPPVKNDKGKTSKAHYQPAKDNPVLMQYGKVYVDTEALAKLK